MTKILAMAVPEPGGSFRREERDLPEPGHHEVRVRVQACGVYHSDSYTVRGLTPDITDPRIPGHEVIGAIDAIGPVGQPACQCRPARRRLRVVPPLRRGDNFACETVQGATGVTRDGGYTTDGVTPSRIVRPRRASCD